MGKYTRVKTWGSEVLRSSDLNAEFDAARGAINNVAEEQIVDGAVTANKFGNGSVTNAKLAARSVTGDKIAVDGVIEENLSLHAVTRKKLGDAEVLWSKLHKAAVARLITPQNVALAAGQSNDQVMATVAHGLQDENGVAKAPSVIIVFWKLHTSVYYSIASDGGATWYQDGTGVRWYFYIAADATNLLIHTVEQNAGASSYPGGLPAAIPQIDINVVAF